MRYALRAEWTKLRTVASPAWLLVGVVVLTVASAVAVTSVMSCGNAGCGHDATRLTLSGVALGQAPVVILAVQAVSGEYGTGMIRGTLAAVPRRLVVLIAKAVVLTGTVAAAGTIAVLASLLVGRHILPRRGFTTDHGYPALSLTNGPTLRAAVGSVLYLVLIALLSLGAAIAIRDAATSTGAVLGLLYLFPILAQTIGDPRWQHLLQQIGPMNAGLAIQATVRLRTLPVGPWGGLGVLFAWAAAAILAGGALFRLRDA